MAKKPFELYTKETCMEFHELLCEPLERFEKIWRLPGARPPKRNKPVEGSDTFKANMFAVLLDGYALQRIARGAALQKHPINTNSLLSDSRA
jgi:hypothetical protein